MNITELIEKLEKIAVDNGDMEVVLPQCITNEITKQVTEWNAEITEVETSGTGIDKVTLIY
jgi:hypothetical protein